jgi:hypothetical protein
MASEKKDEAGEGRPSASIAGTVPSPVLHSLHAVEKPWKVRPRRPLHTHFPQLWRLVWSRVKPLQMA